MATSQNTVKPKLAAGGIISKILQKQIVIPLIALVALILFNLIVDPAFFQIKLNETNEGYKVLAGNIISVIDYGSELAILAIGMTLVTSSSGGQDISVGATIAIAGSVILRVLCGTDENGNIISNPTKLQSSILVAFLIAVLVSMLFGAFNGVLVAYFKIQPMVATLIMFTAGRSIAGWINNNKNMNISAECSKEFAYFGGAIPGIPIPTPVFIAAACMIIIALVLKFTNLRLYSQSVGINPNSSKLNGINPQVVKLITYVILGICVAIAGFIKVSRSAGITYSTIAKDIEMDVILAVALGGNPLGGGKFNITASIIGAYVIQMLTTTLQKYDVKSTEIPAYKAVVVIILVVVSAPVVRQKMTELKNKLMPAKAAKEV